MKRNSFFGLLISYLMTTLSPIHPMIQEQDQSDWIETYKICNMPQKEAALSFLEKAGDDFLEDKIVVDVGCGLGDITIEIAKKAKKVYAIDKSKSMFERAKNFLDGFIENKNIELIELAAEQLEWDNEIDSITSFFCLHSIKDKKTVFQNFYKALKPGGRIVCTIATTDEDIIAMPWVSSILDEVKEAYKDLQNMTIEKLTGRYSIQTQELKNILTECGFASIEIELQNIPVEFKNREEFVEWQRPIFMQIPVVGYIPENDIEYWFDKFVNAMWPELEKNTGRFLLTTLLNISKGSPGF